MNREVLFRGARVCDGKLVNGALVMVKENDESEEFIPNIVISYGPDTFDWFEVDPETVGQFTGMTDKNGTKIFEGDIVKYYNPYSKTWHTQIVKWDWRFAGFGLFDKESEWCKESDWLKIKDIEIVGNIYDNKELLK